MSRTGVGESYTRYRGPEQFDAIVIGSGIGGMTTAALLAKHGAKRVLVAEQHYVAGGLTHSFRRPGYDWDVGVHYVGDVQHPSSDTRMAFDHITDGALEWQDLGGVYDRIVFDDRVYELPAGAERFRARLEEDFPGQARAIERYLERVDGAVRTSRPFFAEKALRSASAELDASRTRPFMEHALPSTGQVLTELTDDPELIGVLAGQWGNYGLPPSYSSFAIHAIVVDHYLRGASYPIGGGGRIAQTIAPVIERQGGHILVGAQVDEITVDARRATGVRMTDGRAFTAPLVISNAGAYNTYERLLPAEMPATQPIRHSLAHIRPSLGHVCLYVGLDRPASDLQLDSCNWWIYPSPHHDDNVQAYLRDPEAPLPVVFASFPSAKDPDFERRHPGRATAEVISLAPYEWFRPWEDQRWRRRGEQYEALKKRFADRLLDQLRKHVPRVDGHIATTELSTPLSTRHFANYAHGEPYGLSHTPQRFENRWLRPRTPIRGLYLTGQDICSCGVASAMMSGYLTASAVLQRDLVSAYRKAGQRTA